MCAYYLRVNQTSFDCQNLPASCLSVVRRAAGFGLVVCVRGDATIASTRRVEDHPQRRSEACAGPGLGYEGLRIYFPQEGLGERQVRTSDMGLKAHGMPPPPPSSNHGVHGILTRRRVFRQRSNGYKDDFQNCRRQMMFLLSASITRVVFGRVDYRMGNISRKP